jgi:CHAT domain-containing protein/tetratricopeptide (TPR) repeat protein
MAQPATPFVRAGQSDPGEATLTTSRVERPLAPGETHTYRLALRAGDFIRIAIDQHEIDAGASLSTPGKVVVAATSLRRSGGVSLSAIAPVSGSYRLEVRSLDLLPATGRYVIRVGEHRRATPDDHVRVAAARLLERADALRARRGPTNLGRAIEHYRQSYARSKAIGDRTGQVLASLGLGEAYHDAGNPEAALPPLSEAMRLAGSGHDSDAVCAALSALARVNLDLGRMDEAERLVRDAIAQSRSTDNRARQVEALNVLGDVSLFNGQTLQALDVLGEALAVAREIGDRRGQALAHVNLGYAAADLSRVSDANRAYDAAVALYRALDDPAGQASALTGQGNVLTLVGAKQQALAAFRRARTLLEGGGDRVGLARASTGIGGIQLDLGEPASALRSYQQALDLFRAVKLRNGEAGTLLPMGLCLNVLGRHREALARYLEALVLIRDVGDKRLEGRALEHLGRGYTHLGELDKAIDHYRQAHALARDVGDPIGEMYALNSIGMLLHRQGAHQQAAEALEAALALARHSNSQVGESLVLYSLAKADSEVGQAERALSRVRASLQLVEALRSNMVSLDLRASYFASIRDRQELEIDLLMRLHEREPSAGYDALAFEASERARARSFLDGLAQSRAGILEGADAGLVARQRTVDGLLNAKAQKLTFLRRAAGAASEIAALAQEIDTLTEEQRDLDAQMRAASPRYASLVAPRPLTLRDMQSGVVDDGSVLLEYFLGEVRSYVWVVTTSGISGSVLPPRADIERVVRVLRQCLSDHAGAAAATADAQREAAVLFERAAVEVSRVLLEPVAPWLESRRVLVVPDGVLHFVPFAALPDPHGGPSGLAAGVPLIVGHEVIHLPSASTVALVRGDWNRERYWSKSVMVFADPVFEHDDPRLTAAPRRDGTPMPRRSDPGDREPLRLALRDVGLGSGGMPRLLEARQEARAIAALSSDVTLALDFDANRGAAMSPGLADYRVVHFATHGVIDNDHPELSGIVLSLYDARQRRVDGFLRLHDIYNLKLPADLVVLSACSTGAGRELVGEGLIGLVRGFMYAGARRVVASLWKVDDEATKELMTRFYRGMFQQGLTPSAALRAAQVEMWELPRWRHPFSWAAFVVQGDWD